MTGGWPVAATVSFQSNGGARFNLTLVDLSQQWCTLPWRDTNRCCPRTPANKHYLVEYRRSRPLCLALIKYVFNWRTNPADWTPECRATKTHLALRLFLYYIFLWVSWERVCDDWLLMPFLPIGKPHAEKGCLYPLCVDNITNGHAPPIPIANCARWDMNTICMTDEIAMGFFVVFRRTHNLLLFLNSSIHIRIFFIAYTFSY